MVNAPESQAVIKVNGDVRNRKGIQNYTKFWNEDSAQDTAAHTEERKEKYSDVINGYYDGATEIYEWAWGSSFHFSRYYKGEAFYQAIARHEHYLAKEIGIRPKMRVLDVGCGVGGPAREIARFTDAYVTGVTINEFQVTRARKYTQKAGLASQVNFVQGDFMHLVELFGENSFDAVYAIEATVHAPDWEGCYNQIKRVLKPGGTFGVYEWCMTDKWDPSNAEHKKIAHGIEVGDGIPEMRSIADSRTALKNVGFEIVHEEDLADRPDEVTWYYPLEGDLRKCQTAWDVVICLGMTRFGIFMTLIILWVLETLRIVPAGTYEVEEALKKAGLALVAGGQQKLFTPMMLFVCKKPLEAQNGH